jgi:CheY-like chemotaxis protein
MNNTILLIEDDELDVINVQRSLAKLDFHVELLVAFNGLEAIDLLERRINEGLPQPKAILLDLNMPRMNGLEFLHQASIRKWVPDIKVFVMTTSSDVSDRNAVDHYHIAGYLIKPLNFNNNGKRQESMQGFFDFHLRNIFLSSEL